MCWPLKRSTGSGSFANYMNQPIGTAEVRWTGEAGQGGPAQGGFSSVACERAGGEFGLSGRIEEFLGDGMEVELPARNLGEQTRKKADGKQPNPVNHGLIVAPARGNYWRFFFFLGWAAEESPLPG